MRNFIFLISAALCLSGAEASWYWPFERDKKEPPRLSERVQKASEMIEEASDIVTDGKTNEAVAKYREALKEIARVERECPKESKDSALMGTLKTKRAYVEATIDSLLLNQARDNAKPVAVSDTTELERKLRDERSGVKKAKGEEKTKTKDEGEDEAKTKSEGEGEAKGEDEGKTKAKGEEEASPLTPGERVMKAISERDYAKADRLISEMLEKKPNDAAALNLRAAKETAEGKFREAENTLDAAIRSNPRDYFAYYNMAVLKLQTRKDDRDGARRYYETGRTLGGPKDDEIEEMLK